MAALIPSQIESFDWDDLKESILFYRGIVEATDDEQIRFQFLEWKRFCSRLDTKPSTPLEALDAVPDRLTIVKDLLTIFCTVPVSTCTAER